MKYVLRFHNITYLHSYLFVTLFPKPRVLTLNKLFGQYFHDIAEHLARIARLNSPRQTYAEQDERYFSGLKGISSTTSSREANHIIENGMLRCQMEMEKKLTNDPYNKQESNISRRAKRCLPHLNTVFDIEIQKSHHWKAYLEKIADFLLPGQGVWWNWEGENVVFYDGKDEPSSREEGPWLAHFRSSNLQNERDKLKEAWKKISEQKVTIPLLFRDMHNRRIVPTNSDEDTNEEDLSDIIEVEEISNLELGDDLLNAEMDSTQVQEVACTESSVDASEFFDVCKPVMPSPDVPIANDNSANVEFGMVSPVFQPTTDERDQNSPSASSHEHYDEDKVIDFNTQGVTAVEPEIKSTKNSGDDANARSNKVTRLIVDVIGENSEVAIFDSLHSKLKLKYTNESWDHYISTLAPLQTRVLRKHSQLQSEVKQWELDFIESRGRAPLLLDYDEKTWELYCKKEKATRLLKFWKIDF